MIHQRTMGRTGLKLSEICLGTLNFGWKTDEATSFAILDAYRAADGNFIQATHYAPGVTLPSASPHASEELVGLWWRSRDIRREEIFLATRILARPPPGDKTALLRTVRQLCEDSMRRLQASYLDLVVFEWDDTFLPIDATLEVFDLLVRSGITRYVGTANIPVWRVMDALNRAGNRTLCRMEALQYDYSLLTRTRFEPEAMELCAEQRLGFFARAPLAGGFLARRRGAGSLLHGSITGDWLSGRYGNYHGTAAQVAASEVAARHDATTAQVALAWVLHNPKVTSAIVGAQSVAQLDDLVRAGSLRLTSADLEQLDLATATEEVRVSSDLPRESGRLAEPLAVG